MIALSASKVKVAATLFSALAFLAISSYAYSDTSESDVQMAEEQEYGIDGSVPSSSKNSSTLQMDNEVDRGTAPSSKNSIQEETRPINAEEFRVLIKRKSTSGRVLLMEDPTENRPRPGKILLIKDGMADIAAVRVLKNYPGKFAVKIVLPFGSTPEKEKEYRALKKLGNKLIELIREEENRLKRAGEDLSDEELAKEVAPSDAELDRGIPKPTPPPSPSPRTPDHKEKKNLPEPLFNNNGDELTMNDISIDDEPEPFSEISVQDNRLLEPHRSALSVEYAGLKNVDKNKSLISYNGIGLRYAYNITQRLLIKRSTVDTLSAELSLFYYKIVAFRESTDQITLTPIILTGRYGLALGESLHPYLYAGFIYNRILAARNVNLGSSELGLARFAGGLGLAIKIGPSWALRGDFGTDMFGVGATLKF